MRGCPDDLAVLSYLEMREHLDGCRSCALLVERCSVSDTATKAAETAAVADPPSTGEVSRGSRRTA